MYGIFTFPTFKFYKFTLDIAPTNSPQTLSSTHQTCFIGFFVRSQPQKHQDATAVLPWTSNIDEAPRNRKTINLDICECTPILRQRDIDTSKDLPRKNATGCQILGKSIVGKYRGGVKMIMVPSAKKYIQYVPYGKIILNSDMHVMQLYGPALLGRFFKKPSLGITKVFTLCGIEMRALHFVAAANSIRNIPPLQRMNIEYVQSRQHQPSQSSLKITLQPWVAGAGGDGKKYDNRDPSKCKIM